MSPRRLHKTARCILVRHGSVLVMQGIDEHFAHLPGGHIDPGEEAIDALIREVREALGHEVGSMAWLATIEDDWPGTVVHETMQLSAAQTYPLRAPLRARESHLRSFWVQWYQVEAAQLRPREVYPWIARVAGSLPCS
jgi:8-oxo-dGTP diphosphatase